MGGTPWPPCKPGPSRRRHLFLCRARSATARRHILALVALALTVAAPGPARAAGPEGQLTWGVHVSLAPTWFDPAETPGIITPFMVLYALHDAVVKPMPGKPLAPSLAESWTVSDGRPHLRVRPAQRREVSQRRAGHGRGREILLRALSRHLAQADQGPGGRDRDTRSPHGPLSSSSAVARLPDLLRAAPPAQAGSCRRSTWRRSARRATRRRRSVPAPTSSCRSRRAWS